MYDENIQNRGKPRGARLSLHSGGLGRSRCVSALSSGRSQDGKAQTPKAAKHRRRPPNSYITYTFYSYYL